MKICEFSTPTLMEPKKELTKIHHHKDNECNWVENGLKKIPMKKKHD